MNPVLGDGAARSHRRTELIPVLMGAAFAPIGALSGKLAKKLGEYRQKRGEKMALLALFRGPQAPFFRALYRRPWIANRQTAKLYVSEVGLPPAAGEAPNRQSSAILNSLGDETAGARPEDLTIVPIVLRRFGSPRGPRERA